MRVIFLGTPEFAVPSLRTLTASSIEVCAVFTQPDRPAGRGQRLRPSAVKSAAVSAGLPVFQPEKIRALENRPLLESFQPDFVVVVAYGQILPRWLLELPRLGCVNVHASLLPRYRGAAPVAWAVLNGDTLTGVTTMLMDEQLDTGPILLKKEVAIPEEITSGQLAGVLAAVGAELLIPTLEGLWDATLKPVPQDNTQATPAPRVTKEMARINWGLDARTIHNLIRGLNPWPLAFADYRGDRVQILQSHLPEGDQPALPFPGPQQHARVHENGPRSGGRIAGETPAFGSAREFCGPGHPSSGPLSEPMPGTFLAITGQGMKLTCGSGSVLEILEVQPAGKKRMSGRDFANGARIGPGQILFS